MSDRPERMRLFVAVDVPLEVREALDAVIARQRPAVPNARWTPVENQHVTLKFLGSVERPRLDAVVDACRGAGQLVPQAEVIVRGTGAFPSPRKARVLWAGIEDPVATLTRLAGELDVALAPLGFEPEKRAFTPHLTLARLKTPADVRAFVEAVVFASDPIALREFHLVRSHLSPKGARYESLHTFVLRDETR